MNETWACPTCGTVNDQATPGCITCGRSPWAESSSGASSSRSGSPWGSPWLVGLAVVLALVLGGLVTALVMGSGNDGKDSVATGATSTTTPSGEASTSQAASTSPPSSSSTSATVAAPKPIEAIDLQRTTFRVLCLDGERNMTPGIENGGNVLESGPTGMVYADVTGDGAKDAVVSLSCAAAGGNGYASSVVVMSSEADGLRQVGAPIDGYGPEVHGSQVVVRQSIYAEQDARCCPSGTRFVPLHLQDGAWRAGGGRRVGPSDQLTTIGLGSLEVSRTYSQVAAATGANVETTDDFGDGSCLTVGLDGVRPGLVGLGDKDTLRMLYVDDAELQTKSGIHIGSTEADVHHVLPSGVEVLPHEYVEGGHYLRFTPTDVANRIMEFETDGQRVTLIKLGETGWASAVEGCA